MVSYLKALIQLKDKLIDLKSHKTDKPTTKYQIPLNLTSSSTIITIVSVVVGSFLLFFILFMLIKYRRNIRRFR